MDKVHSDTFYDSATGLLNYAGFTHELNILVKGNTALWKNFALVLADLDGFSDLQEKLDREITDELLKKISERFQNSIGKGDLFAHFNDERFAFIIRDLKKPGDIHYMALRIVNHIELPIEIETKSLNMNVHLGIAFPNIFPNDAKSLLRNAERAMHEAKTNPYMRYHIFGMHMAIGDYLIRPHFLK